MLRKALRPWLIGVLVFGLIGLKTPLLYSILANNHLQIILTRIGLSTSSASQCVPDISAFGSSQELALAIDRDSALVPTPWSTARLRTNMIRAYTWSGQEAKALALLYEKTSSSRVDPILDLLRWDLQNKTGIGQGNGYHETWGWDHGIFLRRARCWLETGNLDEALIATRNHLRDHAPRWPSDLRDLTNLYHDLTQQCSDAAPCTDQLRALRDQFAAYLRQASASAQQETRAASHFYLGQLFAWEGNTEEALANCRAAVQLEPASLHYRVHLGAWLNAAGLYAESERELLAARNLVVTRADQAWVLGQLGYLYLNQGKSQKATLFFQQSLEADASDVSYQIGLGRAYWNMGEPEKAAEILREVLQIAPDNPSAQQLLKALK